MSLRVYLFEPGNLQGAHRPATPEERRFLRRYNLVRLMRMLLFWLLPLLLLGIIAALHGLLVYQALKGAWEAPILLVLLIPLLFLDWVYLKQWGRPLWQALCTRPWLSVPHNLQVLESEARLGVQVHPTHDDVNIFMAGRTLVDIPEHWEAEVLRHAQADPNWRPSRFIVANLAGAKNRVVRLPMNRIHFPTIRADILLRDIGAIVIGLDHLSAQKEMQARLPVLRGHPGMTVIGVLLAMAAIVLAIVWQQGVDGREAAQQKLQHEVTQLRSRFLSGARVDVPAMRARGYQGLAYLPNTDEKVVSGASFKQLVVSLPGQNKPFLISEAEWQDIQRASFLSPRVMPGYGPIKPIITEKYRQRLIGRLAGERADLTRLRTIVRKMPRAVIEKQLRALANGNRPDPIYVSALLPMPFVLPGQEGDMYPGSPLCSAGEALCRVGVQAEIEWAEPAFITDPQGGIRVLNRSTVARLFEQQKELSSLMAQPSSSAAQKAAIVLGLLALACFVLYWHARWVLKRYWRALTTS